MAAVDAHAIIKRAFSDDTFRLSLMRDFDGTIKREGLQLTKDEGENLRQIDWQNFGTAVGGGGKWVHIYSG